MKLSRKKTATTATNSTRLGIFLLGTAFVISLVQLEEPIFHQELIGGKRYEIVERSMTTTNELATTDSKTNTTSTATTTAKSITQWDDWPAIAQSEIGHKLVTKGDSIFHHAKELYFEKRSGDASSSDPLQGTLFEDFLDVYSNRPDPVNMCGIRINHAMALYLAVKMLKPQLVVESGVNAGVSTYFIRAASAETKIFAIDPRLKPICGQGPRWIDTDGVRKNLTRYYAGRDFVDLLDLDWTGMIQKQEVDPNRTVVFLDDHLHAYKRIKSVFGFGLKHVLVEDNYKHGEGATTNDKLSTPKQFFYAPEYRERGRWLYDTIKSYAEFPPLVPGFVDQYTTRVRKPAGGFMVYNDTNDDIVAPLLRPDLHGRDKQIYQSIAKKLGLDPNLQESLDSYLQFLCYNQICHLELA